MIYFSSDLHFCHDRDFLYKPRGFNSIKEHDEQIIKNWNEIVTDEDEVYILGDLMLNDNEDGIRKLQQLKGKIHIICGNHDENTRIELYKILPNVVEVVYALQLKIGKYYFFLCHYPVLVHNYDDNKKIWNIHGHTHSKNIFSENKHCYNVCLDAHNNKPIEINEIITDIQKQNK